jgi:DNA-directed RNA polymerase alpha subunit
MVLVKSVREDTIDLRLKIIVLAVREYSQE